MIVSKLREKGFREGGQGRGGKKEVYRYGAECREGWWSGDRDRRKGVYSEMGEILKRDMERDALTVNSEAGIFNIGYESESEYYSSCKNHESESEYSGFREKDSNPNPNPNPNIRYNTDINIFH